MKNFTTNIDRQNKSIELKTNFDFTSVFVEKHNEYFHVNFYISPFESVGRAFFYKEFGGRKHYPNEINVVLFDLFSRSVKITYL